MLLLRQCDIYSGRILDQNIAPCCYLNVSQSPHSPVTVRADINPHTRPQGSQVSIKTKYQPAINCNQCCNSPVTNIEISRKFEIHVDFSWNFFSSECKIFVVVHQAGFTVIRDVRMMLGWAGLMTHYPFTVISNIIGLVTVISSNTIILTFYLFLNCLTKCPVKLCGQLAGVRG